MATFQAPRRLFQNAVRTVFATVPRRTPKSVLQTIKVSVNGHVEFTSHAATESTRHSTDWQREGEAECLIDAKQLADAAKLAKGDQVLVEVTADGITLAGMTLPAYKPLPGEEFPPSVASCAGADEIGMVTIDAVRLKEAIEAVEYSADIYSTRYSLGCVLLDFQYPAGTVHAVATDCSRLAVASAGRAVTLSIIPDLKIPSETARRIAKAIDPKAEDTKIQVYVYEPRPRKDHKGEDITQDDGPVRFVLPGGVVIDTEQCQGRFPKWRSVVPSGQEKYFSIDTAELIRLCQLAKNVATVEARGMDWSFDAPNQNTPYISLHVKAGTDRGTIRDHASILANGFDGAETITLDPCYVLDFARAMPKDSRLQLRFGTNTGKPDPDEKFGECPVVMFVSNKHGVAFNDEIQYVTMPLSRDR
jgi:DNA polymerase III sliding clamp (beta) subunit (PCNA family)